MYPFTQLQFINQEHYQDIVEERTINKVCGYPLCENALKSVPAKQYHISTLHNKVFDITDRKNFCNNLCYKASKYLKDQISTSPLWLRESSSSTQYELISLQSKGGFVGDEVDFGILSIKTDLDKITKNDNVNSSGTSVQHGSSFPFHLKEQILESSSKSTNVNSLAIDKKSSGNIPVEVECHTATLGNDQSGTLSETKNNSNEDLKITLKGEQMKSTDSSEMSKRLQGTSSQLDPNIHVLNINNKLDVQSRKDETNNLSCADNLNPTSSDQVSKQIETTSALPFATGDCKVKREKSMSNRKSTKYTKSKCDKKETLAQTCPIQNIVLKVEGIMKEWFTWESFCYVYGEKAIKEMLSEESFNYKARQIALGNSAAESNFYEKYLAVCKKLNLFELEDIKTDASFRGEIKKPLPNYEDLKKEAKEMELKVKMFYKGDKVVHFQESERTSIDSASTSIPEPVLPLVDLHAQRALRRRIVLDKMRKTLQDLQESLMIKSFDLSEDVRGLVSTFNLLAHNVTMKPAEWNLITLFIIKLLSLRNKSLEQGLNTDLSKKHLSLLLMSYSLDDGYLQRVICWLTDMDWLLMKK